MNEGGDAAAAERRGPVTYGHARAGVHRLGRGILIGLAALALLMPSLARATAAPVRLVAFGDSLTAGYLLPQADAFPTVLEAALRQAGRDVTIANAGVSGDTSADGLARLDWSVPDGTDGVLLEFGANDMLRGLDPAMAKENLAAMIGRLQARGIKVMLLGMRATPSLGQPYVQAFEAIYPQLAERAKVPLYPFFLEGVAADPKLSLSDGMHPNAQGVRTIVARVLPSVETFIDGIARPGP